MMTPSRIQSDLLLVEEALRCCPSRGLLKSGAADAWVACDTSLQAVLPILHGSVLADPPTTAVSVLWRKSSASKKLLALLRAVLEEAHALQGEAAARTAAARTVRCRAVHGSISVIRFFWQSALQCATLWPAMREWIVELGGITSLWSTLTWAVMIPMQDFESAAADALHQLLRMSVHSVLALTRDMFSIRRPVELALNCADLTLPSKLLTDLLPRDFAAGNAHAWDLDTVFQTVTALSQLEGSLLVAHLHKPLLVFWPYLMAEMRRQQRQLPAADRGEEPGQRPNGLKVRCRTHSPWVTLSLQFLYATTLLFRLSVSSPQLCDITECLKAAPVCE